MIQIEKLSHTYMSGTPFEQQVIFDVNLKVDDGEFLCIIGPTQSGKSTLIQYFNALFTPKKGKVVVAGTDTSKRDLDLRAIRRMVGLVFQYPEHQLFAETVKEDIAFGLKNLGTPPEEVDERITEALSTVGLDPKVFQNRFVVALSGGQKRRVALASVISLRPRMLILDDPTAGLDPRGRKEILEIVKGLHESGMTVVMVSHQMEDVAVMAERIVVMNEGRIVMDGSPGDIFSRVQELKEIGLGIPQVSETLWALKEAGWPVDTTCLDPERAVEEIERAMSSSIG